MTADIYGGITVDLNDGPVRCEYSRGFDGKPSARLIIGEPGKSIAITVSNSTPATVAELLEAVTRLATWSQMQEQVKHLPEVA